MRWGQLIHDVLDFVYPGRCAVCEGDAAGGAPLCEACLVEMRGLEDLPACRYCAMPSSGPGGPCPHCLGKGVSHYDRVVRLGLFRDPLKHLVHAMKYRGRWGLAEALADRLLEQEPAKALLMETDCLVPVPLHRLRQVERGYNQADVIALRLGSRCKIPVARPAVRLRHTETQTHLHSRAKREENLRHAFGLLDPKPLRGRHVTVVDDVMTTGATLQAFARCLRQGEPASLSALVLAVADPKGSDFEQV